MKGQGHVSRECALAAYAATARLLPTEGRDYVIAYESVRGRSLIRVIPTSDMGAAWVPFLRDGLSAAVSPYGVEVACMLAKTDEERAYETMISAYDAEASEAAARRTETGEN